MIDPLLEPAAPAVRALGWALVHFLWQGCAIAAALAVVRLALPAAAARLRYLAGCAALVAMLASTAATFAILHQRASGRAAPVTRPASAASAPVSAPGLDIAPGVLAAAAPAAPAVQPIDPSSMSAWQRAARGWLDPAIPWLFGAWLVGVCFLSLRLAGGWIAARRLAVRGCEPPAPDWLASLARLRDALAVSRPVRLAASAVAEVPSVIGWLRPVVVVPARVLTGLTPWQVEAILAHELAHIRRHDYLVNLLQSAVETLLFYHPATWWVSRQVREERERCCDDVAVAQCGDAAGYVRALAELEAMRAPPALAMGATGGSLLGRARRLLAPTDTRRSSATVAAAVGIALLVCAWASASAAHQAGGRLPTPAAMPSLHPAPAPRPLPAPVAAPEGQGSSSPELAAFAAPIQAAPPPPAAPPAPSPPPRPAPPRPAASPHRQAPDRGGPDRRGPDRHESDLHEPDLIDEMIALGYTRIPVPKLIALGSLGVRGDFVRAMNGLGFGRVDVDTLLSLKTHGVTAAYARELRAAGATVSRPDQLRAMKIHGVTPAFVREARRLAGRSLSPDELVSMRIHGLVPERRSR